MKQVVIIHGGHSFNSYERYLNYLKMGELDYERLKPKKKWKPWIAEQMPEADVLLPNFPNSDNAVYDEWKIYFEKIIPFLGDDVQLVGHSLGAMFLAKYLQEKPLEYPIRRLVLIAGGYVNDQYEDFGTFKISEPVSGSTKSAQDIHLFHSKDDPIVPFAELANFQADLPKAAVHVFEGRGHFNDETFPELLELLKQK